YTTPNGGDASHAPHIRTSHIAQRLYEALTTTINQTIDNGGWIWGTSFISGPNWYTWVVGSSIIIKNTQGGAGVVFTVSVSDDAAGQNLRAATDQVQAVEDLPKWAEQGYIIRIASNTDPDYDMWMVFETETGSTPLGQGFGE